ncbi:hypothetical protein P3S67_021094 [Capsicum chacoense]
MRHLAENLRVNQHCGEHLYLFYAVEKAYSLDEFSENFEELKYNCPKSLNSVLMDEWEYPVSDNKSASDSLYVTNPNGVLDQYTVFDNGSTAKVNLLERICSCWKFDLVKISSEHAMYGDGVGYRNSIYEYSSPIYRASSYLLAYSKAINVVPPEAEWNMPRELLNTKISPPPYDPKLERKKVKRTKGVGETFKSKRRNRCSICKKSGYKRTTCSMDNKS